MDITIHPSKLHGSVQAIPSKSHAHRILICAAFSDTPTHILCAQTNEDIEATADCLRALGAQITRSSDGYFVRPVADLPHNAELNCRESGSTLRFMLPIVGALGIDTLFHLSGRLPERPLSPLWEEMERMGCQLSRPSHSTVRCCGKLQPGHYSISGGVSSQFITGLLFALSLLPGNSHLDILGKLESKPYVDLTKQVLSEFGVSVSHQISGAYPFRSPGSIAVEGDWSNAAFFLAAAAMGSNVQVSGVRPDSAQGDRAAAQLLPAIAGEHTTVSAADIPDLIPILSVCAACFHGAVFTDIARLRIKESDRVASVCAMLNALGAKAEATENTLTVYPAKFTGGTIDAVGDHRIAMAAGIAATAASGDVTILGAQCASKSYPTFWEEYRRLGGNYEQHIR